MKDNSFQVFEHNSSKYKTISVENDKNLQELNLIQGSEIRGLFKGKVFASAGGLGSTRTLKGNLEDVVIIDHKGIKLGCPPYCGVNIALSLRAE